MFEAGMTQQLVLQTVQQRLNALQAALADVQRMYKWSSGVSAADLTALGFSTADANSILSSSADANGLAGYWFNGFPPDSYPQPQSHYTYGASSAQVVGP